MADPNPFAAMTPAEMKKLRQTYKGRTKRPVDPEKLRVNAKPVARPKPDFKAREMPSARSTGRSILGMLENAPEGLADLAVSVPTAAYDYIRTSTPGDVVSDVKSGLSGFVDYAQENPGEAAADVLVGGAKGAGELLREASLARDAGDEERAAQIEKFAVPMMLAAMVPGGRKVKGIAAAEGRAGRAAVNDVLAAAERRPPVLKGADSPFMVSTRRPTAPNFAAYGNPDKQLLVQTGEALRAAPAAFEKNMGMLAEEPFMRGMQGASPEAIYDEGIRRGADNLKFIMTDLMDPAKVEAARGWYPTAKMVSERAAERAGLPSQAGYGVAAVTSPQTPWDINVARLDRLMDMYGDRFATDPMAARRYVEGRLETKAPGAVALRGPEYAERIAAMPYEELSDKFDKFARVSLADATRNDPIVRKIDLAGEYGDPYGAMTWGSGDSISKALAIMDNPSIENINAQLLGGGKVPSFYNNIANPYSSAPISTIDTHSAGAASLFPGGGNDPIVYRAMGLGPSGKNMPPAASDVARTGSKGLYGPLSDMHTLAAEEMGFAAPREVQSATWEGVRDLWGQEGKTPALKRAIADIWRTAATPEEARFQIAELLGKPVRRMFQVK